MSEQCGEAGGGTMNGCDVPRCDQPAVELTANDAALDSPDYAERYVCRWHRSNPWEAGR